VILCLTWNAFRYILVFVTENAAGDALQYPEIKPRDVVKTGKCRWCKTAFTYRGRDVHKVYCNNHCRKAAWMHRFAMREAEKIIKRRERARVKKLHEQANVSKNGKPSAKGRMAK
jgi:hypothetical protein